jgi:hypothetical protein
VTPEKTARQILTDINLEFNELREKNKTLAWKTRQRRLNEHMASLSELMSVKDLMEEIRRIEDEMKTEGGTDAGSPIDQVRAFLDGPVGAKRVH